MKRISQHSKAVPQSLMAFINKLGRTVFTTHELVLMSGKSGSTIVQSLNRMAQQGLILKVYRGIWAGAAGISPFGLIPYLFPRQRAYVSFITALHLHGIIEQIPQVITLASTSHTRTIHTKSGVFSVHRIAPAFFDGFDWYKGEGSFLIAEPEKALIDSLYLSSRKKKQFGHFPELHFPSGFSFKKAALWVDRIQERKIRLYVLDKLKKIPPCGRNIFFAPIAATIGTTRICNSLAV